MKEQTKKTTAHQHTETHDHASGHAVAHHHVAVHDHAHDNDVTAHHHAAAAAGHQHHDTAGHQHVHENKKAVLNRMSRIIGHMQSVKAMVENDRDCSEVLIQLSAISSAVQSVSRVILKEHLSTCIVEAVRDGDYDSIEELNAAIDKFMK